MEGLLGSVDLWKFVQDGLVNSHDKRKDKIVFQLPISQPVTKIKYPDPSYSLRLLLEDVKEMSIKTHKNHLFFNLFKHFRKLFFW